MGIFRKQDASILSNIDLALEFILKKRLVRYFASCLSTLVKKFGVEKPSFIAIGFGAIPAYSTVAVVGLDYFIHRLVDGAFNTTYLSFIALFVSTQYDLIFFYEYLIRQTGNRPLNEGRKECGGTLPS